MCLTYEFSLYSFYYKILRKQFHFGKTLLLEIIDICPPWFRIVCQGMILVESKYLNVHSIVNDWMPDIVPGSVVSTGIRAVNK